MPGFKPLLRSLSFFLSDDSKRVLLLKFTFGTLQNSSRVLPCCFDASKQSLSIATSFFFFLLGAELKSVETSFSLDAISLRFPFEFYLVL